MAELVAVLGALSAATTLAEQSIKIVRILSELPSKVRETPVSIRKQIIQVQQLVDIARLIEENPPLQTSAVGSILDTCRQEAQSLLVVLGKLTSVAADGKAKKLWKAMSGMRKEKEILVYLERLEREKTSLALCISTIDSGLLHTANLNLVSVETRVDKVFFKVETIHDALPAMQEAIQQLSFNSPNLPTILKTEYYHVPNRRVRGFIGREDVLSEVNEGLTSGPAPRIVVLRGMGGQGKTQIALEYCHRARKALFPTIFWVDATSENSLKTSFESISEYIKPPATILSGTDNRVSFVITSLSDWPCPWLMVLDNYDNPTEFNNIQDFIPPGDQGSILITTRHADVDALGKDGLAIELLSLPEEEALKLLFRHMIRQGVNHEIDAAKSIVNRLGYHPLAITQAGAYIVKRKIGLKDFLDHYNRRRKLILEQTPQISQYRRKLGEDDKETSLTVFTTWELSFQQLRATGTEGERSAELLTLFAFFDWQDISENFFKAHCLNELAKADCMIPFVSELEGDWNRDLFLDVLCELRTLSLLQSSTEEVDGFYHFSIHPLVKDWIRLRTDSIRCQKHSLLAADMIAGIIAPLWQDDYCKMSLPAKREVLSHIAAYQENYNDFLKPATLHKEDAIDLSSTELWFSVLLRDMGRYEEAETIIRRGIELREVALGPENLGTLRSMGHLGRVLEFQEKFEEAERVHRHVLNLRMKILGQEHPQTLEIMNNLAAVLANLNKYEEAENIHRRVLPLREKILGPEHHETLITMNNLASVLKDYGKLEESENMMRDVLRIREKVLGAEHPHTLESMLSLSALIQEQGHKVEEAEALQRRLIPLRVKLNGSEHPDTLKSINFLASSLYIQNEFEEACVYYEEAIRGYQKIFGLEHATTQRCLDEYSQMLEEMKNARHELPSV